MARAFGQPLTQEIYLRAPYLTGRIISVRGEPVVLEQDRAGPSAGPMTPTSPCRPSGRSRAKAGIVAGHWWPANYAGPPLVAMDVEVAKGAAA